MKTYPLNEDTSFTGKWFLPQLDNSPHLAGTLTWGDRCAELSLNGTFTPQRGAIFGDEVHDYTAVHGVTTGSERVSLLSAMQVGKNVSIGAGGFAESERISSNFLVVGAHVTEQSLYSEVSIRVPGLELWIGRSGVTQTIIPQTTDCPSSVVYHIEHLREEIIQIPAIFGTLSFGFEHRYSGDRISEIHARISCHMTIRPDEPQCINWFLDQFGKASTLLSFLAGVSMAEDQISAKLSGTNESVAVLVNLRMTQTCKYKSRHDFFMLRNDMGEALEPVIQNWFEQYDSIATPSQLALSVLNTNDLWSHIEFLSLMQALEGFHRAVSTGLYTSEEEYKAIHDSLCMAIPDGIGSDHRDALKSRIRYGNEISLRKRLDSLASRLPDSLRVVILGNGGSIPRSWVVTRNYYTHWDDASRNSILDGMDMHRAAVRIRLFLRVLYLRFVGISEAAIQKSLVNASYESQYLIQLNSAMHRKANPGSTEGAIMHITLGKLCANDKANEPDQPT
ncbi:HEPN domain-containing protein [Undibacterium sp. Di27W]|uniref:ApeA N-terminal domain 1-containing protein n=1 Tax=Undibacterium sp. Di27W TaxID=3413036 RepID=UPI003BF13D87